MKMAALVLLSSLLVFGQEFEVASIKPSAPDAPGQAIGLNIDGAMVRYSALSLKLYLGMAYNLKNYEISTPDWMASDRWDITAKLPDGSDPKQIPKMLQELLRDRFQMKMHRETKEFPVYGLIIGKGELKLKESPADPAEEAGESPKASVNVAAGGTGAGTIVTYGNGSFFTLGNNKFEGKKLSLGIIAAALARFADRPVLDMTDLKRNYDFTMEFSAEDFRAMMIRATVAQGSVVSPEVLKLAEASSGDTLFNAVEKLGLKLEPRKAPIEMLVIDQALKTPTEN
jgi:uncharacterized protein (TIGR03435 family)